MLRSYAVLPLEHSRTCLLAPPAEKAWAGIREDQDTHIGGEQGGVGVVPGFVARSQVDGVEILGTVEGDPGNVGGLM